MLAEYLYQLDGVGNRILVTETVRAPHAEQAIDAYIEQNGLLVLEAENGTAICRNRLPARLARCGHALRGDGNGEQPRLSWLIYNSTAATYTVWMRGIAPGYRHIKQNGNQP